MMSDGKFFVGGKIYRRVTEMWKKLGVRIDLRVIVINIRKWIVTVCR